MFSSFESQVGIGGDVGGGAESAWWGSNLPNNVGARPHVVVEEGQARFGNEIGEAHVCSKELCVMEERIEAWWLREESKFF